MTYDCLYGQAHQVSKSVPPAPAAAAVPSALYNSGRISLKIAISQPKRLILFSLETIRNDPISFEKQKK